MSTLIQCLLGPRETQAGGQTYNFSNDEHRRAVCEVHNLVHVQVFLSVQHYIVAEPLPIPAAVIPKLEETLLGSSVLPSVVQFDDEHSATLGEIVVRAHTESGLTLADWNALPVADREARLQAVVDAATASLATARAEKDRLAQERAAADEAIRLEHERQEAERISAEAERLAGERIAAEQAAKDAAAAAALAAADPLIDISGIGEATVPKLHDLGVTTFAQIAAWDDAKIAEMDKLLRASGGIKRSDWVGQAKQLQADKEAALAANPPKAE
jgi:predicted flap endonuclease-1-like 5' DNA nuclease